MQIISNNAFLIIQYDTVKSILWEVFLEVSEHVSKTRLLMKHLQINASWQVIINHNLIYPCYIIH